MIEALFISAKAAVLGATVVDCLLCAGGCTLAGYGLYKTYTYFYPPGVRVGGTGNVELHISRRFDAPNANQGQVSSGNAGSPSAQLGGTGRVSNTGGSTTEVVATNLQNTNLQNVNGGSNGRGGVGGHWGFNIR
jgi:hypothetical protein